MRSGQISVEVLAYYGILMTVFLVVTITILNNQLAVDVERANMDARRLLVATKNEIDIATAVGDGYSSRFVLPEVLRTGEAYTLGISGSEIYVEYAGRNVSLPLLTDNFSSGPSKGMNTIRNDRGMIVFE